MRNRPVESGVLSTPTAGRVIDFVDSDKILKSLDATGLRRSYWANWSVASQAPAATTRTYLTGSAIAAPVGKFQIGTLLRWTFDMTKTGAGTATSTIDVCFGTAGTTADTARASFTKPAGTAVIDCGKVVIEAIIRGPLTSSCIVSGTMTMIHNLQITGHMVIPCCCVNVQSSGFDITTASLIAGVCLTSGASDAITIQQVLAEAWNL